MKPAWTKFALSYFAPLFSLFLIVAFCAVSLAASSGTTKSLGNEPADLESVGGEHARLLVDNSKGTVTIVIEDREVARFDKNGLHVVGDIDYTGSISDTSATWLEPAHQQGESVDEE